MGDLEVREGYLAERALGQLLLHLSEGIQNDLLILFRQGSEGVVVHDEEHALERMAGRSPGCAG